jgi:hypothetical protein
MCFAYKVKNSDYIISLWPFPLGRPSCPFIYSIDRRAITPVSDSSSRLKAFRFTWYDPISILTLSSTAYGRLNPKHGSRPGNIILPPALANNSSYLSGGGSSHQVKILQDKPTYYHSYTQKGPVSIAQASTSANQWCPPFLPVLRHNHPIENLISDSSREKINLCCQQPLDKSLVHITGSRLTSVTTRLLRELISHGQMVQDNVLNVFLEILTTEYQINYLSTFFIHILQRDRKWDNAKRWFNDSDRRPCSYRPTLQSPVILIPCHVHGNHWVALIRRIQNNRVHFYYSDDMNHPPTEQALKHLLQTSTDNTFYPDNAKWIKCHSLTYRPHSNECGPRTLLALAVLGLHHNPTEYSLMPFMTSNLAQILRTWVASSILSGEVHVPTLPDSIEIIRTAYGHSTPYSLIQWTTQRPNLEGTENATRTHSRMTIPPKSTTSEEQDNAKLHTSTRNKAQTMNQRGALCRKQSTLSSSTRIMVNRVTDGRGKNSEDESFSIAEETKNTRCQHTKPKKHSQWTQKKKKQKQTSIRKFIVTQPTLYDYNFLKPHSQPTTQDPDIWGHVMESIDSKQTFRILLQNPNGIHPHISYSDFLFGLHIAETLGVGALCMPETNLNWNSQQVTATRRCLARTWRHCSFQFSQGEEQFDSLYKPGGTLTAVTDL